MNKENDILHFNLISYVQEMYKKYGMSTKRKLIEQEKAHKITYKQFIEAEILLAAMQKGNKKC